MKPDLFKPVPILSLVFFRIIFGIAAIAEVGVILFGGMVKGLYIEPAFHFKYYGFGWVSALPAWATYIWIALISISALFISLGFLYRFSTITFFCTFTYFILIEQAKYNNHWYLTSLIGLALIFIPAHRYFSLDVKRDPSIRSYWIYNWQLWLIIFLVGIPYFYGGLAKLNVDWLQGQPMHIWLQNQRKWPFIGEWMTTQAAAYVYSYGGILFDTFIVFFLLWKRTRLAAYIVVCTFHINNMFMFGIGNFPYFMIAATLIFFDADWPLQFASRFNKLRKYVPVLSPTNDDVPKLITSKKGLTLIMVGGFVLLQLLIPLRHWAYPGVTSWTEEGHRFAWRMMLRNKSCTGSVKVIDSTGVNIQRIRKQDYLTDHQGRKMMYNGDMIIQFAHFIGKEYERNGWQNFTVHAEIACSLNGRPYQYMIDPALNLLEKERALLDHYDWIMPLKTQSDEKN